MLAYCSKGPFRCDDVSTVCTATLWEGNRGGDHSATIDHRPLTIDCPPADRLPEPQQRAGVPVDPTLNPEMCERCLSNRNSPAHWLRVDPVPLSPRSPAEITSILQDLRRVRAERLR